MGEFGVLSRILAPKFGAFLTFAALRPQAATAPGQPTLEELVGQYRFANINASTQVYAIIGYPVTHSLSPLVHNAAFSQYACNAVYVPMPIPSYDDPDLSYAAFRAALLELIEHPQLSFAGASVTMPHKANLARVARESGWLMDEATKATNIANTLIVRRDASEHVIECQVLNTDVPALARCIDIAASQIRASTPLRIGVVGAGGAGTAAAFAALKRGDSVVIYNRDRAKAQRIADQLLPQSKPGQKVVAMPLDALAEACCDVFVQATPVGLGASNDAVASDSPIPIANMTNCPAPPRVGLIETIYNPLQTSTVKAARQAGWHVIDGVTMFVEQAALQSEAWKQEQIGKPSPRDLFDQLVRQRLGEQADKATKL